MRIVSKLSIASVTMTMGLAACTSMQTKDESTLQRSGVYVVGDTAAPVQMNAFRQEQDVDADLQGDAIARKLYWFLAGR